MLTTIIKAAENFCIHQIREEHRTSDTITKMRTFIAHIDIETSDLIKHRVYLGAKPAFVQRISKIFLEEDESDEETLRDMTLELTNLVVGSAKVIAEEENENTFTITTPNFEKLDTFDFKYDQAKVVAVGDDEMILAIKELD